MMTRTLLAFSTAGVRLGLDAAATVEVVRSVRLVTPPELPPLVRGFMDVGGRLIPVLRLEKLLNGARAPEANVAEEEDADTALRLTDRVVIARLADTEVAWVAGADMEPVTYHAQDVAPLPADHVLNNCATHVLTLPQAPPVILLSAEKLLLEGERLRLAQLRERAAARLALLESGAEAETGTAATSPRASA
ncbi:MAG: chemotaxis protein CheW [Prosthecobacter sp.]